MNINEFLARLSEDNPDAMYPSNMKKAIIGSVDRYGMETLILIDRNKCLKILMKDGMTRDEAEDFFEINVIGAYMGRGTPCFATLLKDEL